MEKREATTIATVERRLCDQVSGGPSGVRVQSTASMATATGAAPAIPTAVGSVGLPIGSLKAGTRYPGARGVTPGRARGRPAVRPARFCGDPRSARRDQDAVDDVDDAVRGPDVGLGDLRLAVEV